MYMLFKEEEKKGTWLTDDGLCIVLIFASTQRPTSVKGSCIDSYASSISLESHQSLLWLVKTGLSKRLKPGMHGQRTAQTLCT